MGKKRSAPARSSAPKFYPFKKHKRDEDASQDEPSSEGTSVEESESERRSSSGESFKIGDKVEVTCEGVKFYNFSWYEGVIESKEKKGKYRVSVIISV